MKSVTIKILVEICKVSSCTRCKLRFLEKDNIVLITKDKERMIYLDFSKIKEVYSHQRTQVRIKKQVIKQDIFCNRYIWHKTYFYWTQKISYKSTEKYREPIREMGLNRCFIENKFKCLINIKFNFISYKDIPIKTTMIYYIIPTRMSVMKATNNTKCWQGCGTCGTLIHCL